MSIKTTIFNCGGFIRRKSDEIDYRPGIGVLYDDGSVERRYLKTDIDKFHENSTDIPDIPLDLQGFIHTLENLGEHAMDFRQVVKNHLESDDVDKETKEIILQALQ